MSQAAPDIYTDCLLPLRHGYPLFRPEPHECLPTAYRTEGVSIGDVGIITPEGYFDFLFNICQNDVNENGVPDGMVLIGRGEILKDSNYFGKKAVVANGLEEDTSVSVGGGIEHIG
jgi:hypothetical protein